MVVHAVVVLSKSGKILVSRPYVDMPGDTIDKYMREFLLLLKPGQEHNHVETENKYYIFLPIESVYVVIVTDKDNILAYMDTLKLLHKLVSVLSSALNEKGISKSAVELIFAFDEVITPMGYTYDVDFDQVMTNLEMYSENELSHNLKTQLKVSQTKEVMKEKAKEIENKKFRDAVTGASSAIKDVRNPSAFVKDMLEAGSSVPIPQATGRSLPIIQAKETSIRSSDPVPPLEFSSSESPGDPPESMGDSTRTRSLRLQRDKGKEATIFVEAVEAESMEEGRSHYRQSETITLLPSDPVVFSVKENIHVTRYTSKDRIEFDLHGILSIQIPVHLGALEQVQIEAEENLGILFEPAPEINKELFFNQCILSLKDLNLISHIRPNYDLNILHWNMTSANKSVLPLLVDFISTSTALHVRYKASPMSNPRNVLITVRIPNLSEEVASGIRNSPGTYRCNYNESTVQWFIPLMEESNDRTGTLEIPHLKQDALTSLSVSVDFDTESTLSKLKVVNIVPMRPGDPRTFSQYSQLSTKKYKALP